MESPSSTTSVSGHTKKHGSSGWFTAEIQQMMHGFGDCRKPLLESVTLVENIVRQQLTTLIHQAVDVNQVRSGRYLGLEDILFALRKDKIKLRRLIRYLELKDLKAAALKGTAIEEEDNGENSDSKPQPRKRRKVCYDFLSTIDQTGELLTLFDDDGQDEIKMERQLRAELQTRHMDPDHYLQYCEARQVSFCQKYKTNKFKDWLMSSIAADVKFNPLAIEVLSYLAYECVAQIVDLALLVRQDKRARIEDPLSNVMPSIVMNHDYTPLLLHSHGTAHTTIKSPSSKASSPNNTPPHTPSGIQTAGLGPLNQSTTSLSSSHSSHTSQGSGKAKAKKRKRSGMAASLDTSGQAIQPADIREAIRRYTQPQGVFTTFSKSRQPSPRNVLLFC